MKKNTKLTVVEFEKLCNEVAPAAYIFDARNQPWGNDVITLKASLTFDNMMVFRNPNRVCLTYGDKNLFGKYDNFLKFERVKYILYKGMSAGCRFFSIVCENFSDQPDVEYCFTVM